MKTIRTAWFPPSLVALTLLLLGAQAPLARWIVVGIVGLAFTLHVARSARDTGIEVLEEVTDGARPMLLLGLPLLAAAQVALQLFVPFSDGPVASMIAEASRLAALAIFYLLVARAARTRDAFRFLLGAAVAIGAIEAAYGLFNLLAGNEYLLVYKRWAYKGSATGTLVNRNHFAYLMEMLLPATIAYAAVASVQSDSTAPSVPRADAKARTAILGTACFVEGLALIFSRSRMGIASLLLALASMVAINRLVKGARLHAPDTSPPVTSRTVAVLLTGAIAVFALAIGIDPVIERFFDIERGMRIGDRPAVWKATLAMVADKPLLGHGFGTFAALFPAYRSAPTGFWYSHAHNDYLEILAEGGVLGLGLALWLVVAFARRLIGALRRPATPGQHAVVFWLGTGIVSVLLHSTADFGLRITAVGFTFVLLVALFVRATDASSTEENRRTLGSHRKSPARA